MNGDAMVTDAIRAEGVRLAAGGSLASKESPPFIQGVASIPQLQRPEIDAVPFTSRFEGLVATASCQKDGGVNSNRLIDSFGYQFLHREIGGPFNSIKVHVGLAMKHVPGIEEEVERLSPHGLSPHVLWSGGVIRNVNGETRLTDTGFMEGSIMRATPKKFPPPYLIQTSDLADLDTLTAKSLQGVIVRFEDVTIDSVSEPDERRLRPFVFHDGSGAQLRGVLFSSITRDVEPGSQFKYLRGLVDRPVHEYVQVIVELDEHLR